MRKKEYPPNAPCLGQKKNEAAPCPDPRRSCARHCNADSENSLNGRCPTTPMGNGRCRMHGGKSLKGRANPSYRHGRYSEVVKGGLSDGYERALKDTVYVELKEEIALVQGFIEQELAGREDGGGPRHARRLREGLDRFAELQRAGEEDEAAAALNAIFRGIRAYASAYDREAQVKGWIEQRRKLSDSETRRRDREHEMWHRDRVLALVEAVMHLLSEHVTDRGQLASVTDGLIAFVRNTGLMEPADARRN